MAEQTLNSLDLRLPEEKAALPLDDWRKTHHPTEVRKTISNYAIGSNGENIYYKEDLGLFQAVNDAWKNHWNLRTSPEDWWMPVAMRVAKAIDEASKAGSKKVREVFVEHEGKKALCVDVDVFTIYQVDYESFFRQMAGKIRGNIKCAEFAEVMQNDFGTSEQAHQVSSQINLMASMQQFFSYEMALCGCGIKGIEMLGSQEDWDKLLQKFQKLRTILEPIYHDLSLYNDWFDAVEKVYTNLAKTFAASGTNNPVASEEIADFWADIFMIGDGWKYGPSGMNRQPAKEYNGWLIEFITGYRKMLVEDFNKAKNKAKFSGLNKVPMKITEEWKPLRPPPYDADLIAGIMGYTVHQENTLRGVPSIQPHHIWALCLPMNSPLRGAGISNDSSDGLSGDDSSESSDVNW